MRWSGRLAVPYESTLKTIDWNLSFVLQYVVYIVSKIGVCPSPVFTGLVSKLRADDDATKTSG